MGVHFSRHGKHREFAQNVKNMFLHGEFTFNTVLKIKGCTRIVMDTAKKIFGFEANLEMGDNPIME